MPLRASMLRYFSAVLRNILPSGPLVIVIELGGAGRTKRMATHIPTMLSKRTGPRIVARSRHEIATNRARSTATIRESLSCSASEIKVANGLEYPVPGAYEIPTTVGRVAEING